MTTITTLLSGGECVGVGARASGLEHLEGFEIDDSIASVARMNGFNVHTANVLELDPTTLQVPDILHASPVCKNASVANQSAELNEDGTKESPFDIAMGEKVAQFIDVMTPKVFTLENVYAYRKFKAFQIVLNALNRNGYMYHYDNLNAADYGVPQTRRRLILRAVRGALLPMLPQPERWVGWYEAIEDLIPGLPESQFAAWQLARLPELAKSTLVTNAGNQPNGHDDRQPVQVGMREPVPSVTAQFEGRVKAFILAQGKYGDDLVKASGSQPIFTVTANSNQAGLRAWLVESKNMQEWGDSKRRDDEPAMTVNTDHKPSHSPKAWLSQGRVVRMTPRALARFQSLPDDYTLPDSSKLACTVIGNGVPPKLYQKIIRPLTEATR